VPHLAHHTGLLLLLQLMLLLQLLLLLLLLLWLTLRTTRGSPADLSSATQRCCMACLKPTSDTSDAS
jgi:hypothetical protein